MPLSLRAPGSWLGSGRGSSGSREGRGRGEDADRSEKTEDLVRALEAEMLDYLRTQNRQLQDEVWRLREGRSSTSTDGSWQKVGSPRPAPPRPPPEPTTPVRAQRFATPLSPSRWTPNGTEVPAGPPPEKAEEETGEMEVPPPPWRSEGMTDQELSELMRDFKRRRHDGGDHGKGTSRVYAGSGLDPPKGLYAEGVFDLPRGVEGREGSWGASVLIPVGEASRCMADVKASGKIESDNQSMFGKLQAIGHVSRAKNGNSEHACPEETGRRRTQRGRKGRGRHGLRRRSRRCRR